MGVPPLPLLLAAALVVFIAWALYRAANPPVRRGALLTVDSRSLAGSSGGAVGPSPQLVSHRYGLSGRPDEIRRAPDGTPVPVEIKSSKGPPPGGPVYDSHRIQLLAYCLLLEEHYGRSPPYGLLLYADGEPRPVRWDAAARAELLGWVERIRLPYRGEASPSPEKCARCTYHSSCDAASRAR